MQLWRIGNYARAIMGAAQDLAEKLAGYFHATGRFEDVQAAAASSSIGPASTGGGSSWQDFAPFADLSVRAVGAAEGETPTCFIYVTRAAKKLERMLNTEVDDVRVRVKKVGRMIVRPELAQTSSNRGNTYRRSDKIACGSSIAPAGAELSGTLGAFVRDELGQLFALSNNHVIGGCNHMPAGHPITSPSSKDVMAGGPEIRQFATFARLIELRSGDRNHVPVQECDAAIAAVAREKLVSSWQGDLYETPTTTCAPEEDMIVEKVGRTTGHTTGIIESKIVSMMPLPYKDKRFAATVNYANVWAVASTGGPFALPGDSGSLVVTQDGGAAVGLLFAVSNDGMRAFFTDIRHVLKGLGGGLSLATGL